MVFKNAAIFMSGTVAAQGITLIAVPILSRIYAPSDFGVFGIYATILSMLGVVGCLRYELAVILPQGRRVAAQVFALAGSLALMFSLLVLLLVIVGRHALAGILMAPTLAQMLWWLPLSVLGYSTYQLLNYWTTRSGRFKDLAAAQVFRSGSASLIQISAAPAFVGGGGLVLGQLIGQWVGSFALAWRSLPHDIAVIRSGFKWRVIWKQARRYKTFPIHGAPQALSNSVSQSVPVLMLGFFFSPAIVGFYVMTNRVVAAPCVLISQAMRQAILPIFASRANVRAGLWPIFRKYTLVLCLLGIPVVAVFVSFGPLIFTTVMGSRWTDSGRYAEWVALWLWADMAHTPAVTLLTVLERQRLQLVCEVLLLICRVLALTSALITHSAIVTIAAFSLVGFGFNAAIITIGGLVARRYDEKNGSAGSLWPLSGKSSL